MNNLTNTILTKVTNLAQTSSAITNMADKLLSHILPEENAAAWCVRTCGSCGGRRYKPCRECCFGWVGWECNNFSAPC